MFLAVLSDNLEVLKTVLYVSPYWLGTVFLCFLAWRSAEEKKKNDATAIQIQGAFLKEVVQQLNAQNDVLEGMKQSLALTASTLAKFEGDLSDVKTTIANLVQFQKNMQVAIDNKSAEIKQLYIQKQQMTESGILSKKPSQNVHE